MKKELKKQIDWYLEFARLDLKALTKGEIAKLIFEARELIIRGLIGIESTEATQLGKPLLESGQEKQYSLEWLLQLQNSFLKTFRQMMDRIERLSEFKGSEWEPVGDSEIAGGLSIAEPLQVSFSAEIKVEGPCILRWEGEVPMTRASRDWFKNSTILIKTQPAINDKNLFIYVFVKSLSGLPTKAFRRCRECQNWFFHSTKRNREFCNNLCAARNANRIRRAKEKENEPKKYEAELEKERKRARKNYRSKVKKMHPNARISSYRKK